MQPTVEALKNFSTIGCNTKAPQKNVKFVTKESTLEEIKRKLSNSLYMMVTTVGLPLLIVNGKFQSLGSMTVEDLETFIPFLVNCSVNRAGAQVINGVPEWWPSSIKYQFPLKKPNGLSQVGYRKHLSSIVCRCYWYHDAQYLLPFCAEIANRPETVFLKNNEDNTTSIFYVHNTIHIMKFSNENKNYDMKPKTEKTNIKCLLSALPRKSVPIPDIYLCENCDAEFSSHNEMLKHEKDCYEIIINGDNYCDASDDVCDSSHEKHKESDDEEIEVLQHIKPITQSKTNKDSFLNYLKLHPKDSGPKTKRKVESRSKHCLNRTLSSYKSRHIEFSSIFGRKLLEHSLKKMSKAKIQKSFLLNESYCSTNVNINKEWKEPLESRVTTRRHRKRNYVHQYSFSKKQRRSRYKTLKTGLDEKSRKLLKQCKELRIVLNRLKLNL